MTIQTSGRYLLDTHVIVWSELEPEKLTSPITDALTKPDATFFVSASSVAEIACAFERGRIRLARHWKTWFREALEANGWTYLPVSLEVMEEAYSLPGAFHPDPGDRTLVATARVERLTLLTVDRKILDYPHVKAVG